MIYCFVWRSPVSVQSSPGNSSPTNGADGSTLHRSNVGFAWYIQSSYRRTIQIGAVLLASREIPGLEPYLLDNIQFVGSSVLRCRMLQSCVSCCL